MNPSLDIATATERVVPTDKLRCQPPRRDPGGGGINVARVVHILGGQATAIHPAGGATGSMFEELLAQAGVGRRMVQIGNPTREAFTIDEAASGKQFRFVLPGPELTEEEAQRCLDELAALEPRPAFVVASGSLPPGVPDDFYARGARLTRELGVRLVVDTSAAALRFAGREESQSEHPIAGGVVRWAKERGLAVKPVRDFRNLPGEGPETSVEGREVKWATVGSIDVGI
jgi:6-phosphofructokinase 2